MGGGGYIHKSTITLTWFRVAIGNGGSRLESKDDEVYSVEHSVCLYADVSKQVYSTSSVS